MKIRVLCVGKLKERYLAEAQAEYAKRISRYANLEIVEVADEKTPEKASAKQVEEILRKEGERLLSKIQPGEYVIALAIKGAMYDSEGFAAHLMDRLERAGGSVTLIIGGSLGLSGEVLSRTSGQISFSKLTFPHQLMRVLLLEQIYRAFRILRGEPYHK